MASPQIWLAIGRWLGVPDPLSRAVWDGLRRAQGSAGVALRQSGLWHDPLPAQLGGMPSRLVPFPSTGLLVQAAAPANLIEALESCVDEQVLSRKHASQFEQYVLAAMVYEPGEDGREPRSRWLSPEERATRAARMQRIAERVDGRVWL